MIITPPVPLAAGHPPRVGCPDPFFLRSFVLSRSFVALVAAVLAACTPPAKTDPNPDPDPVCESGQERDCYDGPEGTFGVGSCRAGTQTCIDGEWGECTGAVTPTEEVCNGVDDDCDGSIDEGVTNACGGCGDLEEIPGDLCESCGTWTCADLDTVLCVGDREPASSDTCLAENGCTGAHSCEENGLVTCHAVEERNQCNTCGGPDLPDFGDTCTTDDGCEGTWVCNDGGTDLHCEGPARNECGVCGGAAVASLGDSCIAENGCDGTLHCNVEGTGTSCVALVEKNQCGVCGGPDLANFGLPCDVDGCSATWTCNAAGDELFCDSTGRNNCAACDAPQVEDLNSACWDDDGCEGVLVCDAEGTGSTCKPHFTLNECEVCGPPVADVGGSCEDEFLCPGVRACNGEGTGTICSVTRPAHVGNNCFDANGCPGAFFCDGEGGITCVAEEPCQRPSHVVISEISVGRGDLDKPESNNQFIELYNPTDEPYDLTQLQIWISQPGIGQNTPPAGSTRACVGCIDPNGHYTCVTNSWAADCKGHADDPDYAIIQPRSYFLIGYANGYSGVGSESVPAPDGRIAIRLPYLSEATKEPTGGQIWLFKGAPGDDGEVVDYVGYGTASMFEGEAAAPLHSIATVPAGPNRPLIQSIERKAFRNSTAESMSEGGWDAELGNGSDTNDNANDFVVRPVRNPQNRQSPPEPALPDPAG